MELGTVISTYEGPSTTHFSFVVTHLGVRKGQFVQSETEDGLLIGVITDILRANRYFERPESVAEYEKIGTPLAKSFPVTDWEYILAKVKPLGVYKNGNLIRSTFPAAPGVKVFSADEKILKDFLGFRDDGLNIGSLENHKIEVKLSLNELFQKHLAILAMSGAGKSHLASVLIEGLLERKKEQGRIAIIVLDVHGEYLGFKEHRYAEKTNVIDGRKIRIAVHKLSPQALGEFIPELSGPQKRDIAKIIGELKMGERRTYHLKDLMNKIEDSGMKETVKSTLLSWLSELSSLRLFGNIDYPSLDELARPGVLSVVNLSDIDNQRKKQLITAYFARRLFRARKKERIPPFLLLIEESHTFAREKAPKSEAVAKRIIETIAREGRKFGASLCLISQRPVQLSTTALSQCNSHIIMRVTNPYDLKHIGESCEGIDSSMLNAITTLRTGEALIIGEAVNYPIFIKVRKRLSKESTKGKRLELIAKNFEEINEKKGEDVEAFL